MLTSCILTTETAINFGGFGYESSIRYIVPPHSASVCTDIDHFTSTDHCHLDQNHYHHLVVSTSSSSSSSSSSYSPPFQSESRPSDCQFLKINLRQRGSSTIERNGASESTSFIIHQKGDPAQQRTSREDERQRCGRQTKTVKTQTTSCETTDACTEAIAQRLRQMADEFDREFYTEEPTRPFHAILYAFVTFIISTLH
ncbi:unnamed protein product [Anisakis simplex]|uniref:Uncharacterized protein n=1 Tax=Anisakis simplex TaxID=6269 RepID=A0A0M3JZN7_ANISI|nr:unnamed protein product [Anisakis simplex]